MLRIRKLSKNMSSNSPKNDENSRALGREPWERPVVRRLITKDAEGSGMLHDEGNPSTGGTCVQTGPGMRSCKNA
jgi:hypothetical protein